MTIQRIRFIVAVLPADRRQSGAELLPARAAHGNRRGPRQRVRFRRDRDYISRGQDESPALIAVDEGKIHEDAAVVLLMEWRDGVGESELLADLATFVEEEWEWDGVLVPGEVTLADGLRRDGNDQASALAHNRIEIAPGFELGDAVRAPASAKKIQDDRADGEQVCGPYQTPRRIGQGELRHLRADGQNAVARCQWRRGLRPRVR